MNFKYWFSNFRFFPVLHWYELFLCLLGKHQRPTFMYGKYDNKLNKSHYFIYCTCCNKRLEEGIEE